MNDCKRENLKLLAVSLLAACVLVASAFTIKFADVEAGWRIGIALAPVPFYVFMFITAVRAIRMLDELKRRIQLEALAVAVIGLLLTVLTYGMLTAAEVGLPAMDWSAVWVVTTLFYIAGNVLAWRRYR